MKNPDNLQSSHVTRHKSLITREDRERLHKHKGAVLWFTGLSASGKSTISHLVEEKLHNMCCSTYVFDGDNVRHGLCGDLSFSEKDRAENIRRDPEGIYPKALKGEITDFTGISSPDGPP